MASTYVFLPLLLMLSMTPALVDSLRILLLPTMSKSHLMDIKPVAEELIKNGHEVVMTMSSRYHDSQKIGFNESYFKIAKYSFPEDVPSYIDDEKLNINPTSAAHFADMTFADVIQVVDMLTGIFNSECEYMLKDEDFINFLRSYKFDLAVVQQFHLGMCNYIVPHVLDIKYISYALYPDPAGYRIPFYPSMSPYIYFPGLSLQMDFKQRLLNLILHIMSVAYPLGSGVRNCTLIEKYSQNEKLSNWNDFIRASELVLVAQDFVLLPAVPLLPHVKFIGTTTSSKEAKPLSDDITGFIESSEKGVILISMGSYIDVGSAFEQKVAGAVEKLTHIGYSVIWKTKTTTKLDASASRNVLQRAWIPQSDILSHPKVRLFITHCGKKGVYESLHYGVPMLGIPFFGDQPYNAEAVKAKGYGDFVNHLQFTVDEMVDKSRAILLDESYRKNCLTASRKLKASRPASEVAVEWIEYTITFGTDHLKSVSLSMHWFQYYMVDMFLFVVGVLQCVMLVLYCICVRIASKCSKRKHKTD